MINRLHLYDVRKAEHGHQYGKNNNRKTMIKILQCLEKGMKYEMHDKFQPIVLILYIYNQCLKWSSL